MSPVNKSSALNRLLSFLTLCCPSCPGLVCAMVGKCRGEHPLKNLATFRNLTGGRGYNYPRRPVSSIDFKLAFVEFLVVVSSSLQVEPQPFLHHTVNRIQIGLRPKTKSVLASHGRFILFFTMTQPSTQCHSTSPDSVTVTDLS